MIIEMVPGIKEDAWQVNAVVAMATNLGLTTARKQVGGNGSTVTSVHVSDGTRKVTSVPAHVLQGLWGVNHVRD